MRRELDCGGVPCLKLEFRRTDSGGQCLSGCHAPQRYAFAGALEPRRRRRRRRPPASPRRRRGGRPARAERARAQHQQELRHLPREGGEALRQGPHPRPGARRRLQFLPPRPRAGEPADPPGPRGSHLRPLPRSGIGGVARGARRLRARGQPLHGVPRPPRRRGRGLRLRTAPSALRGRRLRLLPRQARPKGGRSPGTSPRSAAAATTKSGRRSTRTALSPPKAASAATGHTPRARRRCCAPRAPRSASPATRGRASRSRRSTTRCARATAPPATRRTGRRTSTCWSAPTRSNSTPATPPSATGCAWSATTRARSPTRSAASDTGFRGRDEEPARAAPARPGVALRTRDPRPARHHLPQLPRPARDRVAATDPPRARLQRRPLPPDRIQEDRRRRQVPRRLPHHPVLSTVRPLKKAHLRRCPPPGSLRRARARLSRRIVVRLAPGPF